MTDEGGNQSSPPTRSDEFLRAVALAPALVPVARAGVPASKRFSIRGRIGEGGMGVVYEAYDNERRTPVALKTLNRFDGAALARFKREFRTLQGLVHPNLVALDELFFENDQWFFTMELLEGVDFVNHVRGASPRIAFQSTVRESMVQIAARPALDVDDELTGCFDERRLREALRQLLEGLATLHAADKVHRDVKPSNVLVTREGRVVLLDFGLVTEASSDDPSTAMAVVGTPSYMAPEQAASRDVGPAADMYAVGVMLYEALTGVVPIAGAPLKVLMEKQTREPSAPSAVADNVPVDLDALCVKLLRIEATRRPSAAELLRSLGAGPAKWSFAPRSSTEAPPFVGREAELRRLHQAFEETAKGKLATVLVCGESGIGKSYLVRHFTEQIAAQHSDAVLLEGRCYERETVPYKALDGIVDALSRRLSRTRPEEASALLPARSAVLGQVFPIMLRVPQVAQEHAALEARIDPHELRQRAFAALRDLLTRLAVRRPTIVVIDDMQWADEDGLRALAEVLRSPDPPPLLLVGTVRAPRGEVGSALGRLRDAIGDDVPVVELASLGHDEARTLAAALLRRAEVADADPDRIATEAGGHPLFVEELARHLVLGGPARTEVKLDDAIWSRITQLETATRQMAELVAVAGKPLAQEVVANAAHLEPGEFHRRAALLRVSTLVKTGGARWADAIEPYHDRVREAVLARLDPERRRALHETLAIAFEASSNEDAETLATHWREAGNAARSSRYAAAAGDQAAKTFAFDRAARWYEQALELIPAEDTGRRELRIKLGDALANGGRGALAARHFEAAAAESAPMQALDLRRRAAEELLSAGRFDEGDAVLSDVLEGVGMDLPRTPVAALISLIYFRLVLALRGLGFRERTEDDIAAHALTRLEACNGVGRVLSLVDTIRGAYFQTRALLAALAIGEPKRIAHALSIEAVYRAASGRALQSRKLLDQARSISDRAGSVQLQALVELSTGFAHFTLGRFEAALVHCDRSIALLREHCPGAWWELRTAQLAAMWTAAWTGKLNELASRAEQGVREAQYRGDIYAGTTLRTGTPNLAWLRKGNAADARAVVLDAMDQWTQRGYHLQHFARLIALARIDLYEGNGREAYARISREWPQVARAMILQVRIQAVEVRHLRASAALAAAMDENGSERARLLRAAERDGRRLEAMGWSVATGGARLVRAGVAAMRGDPTRAAAELVAAADQYDALAMALHAAASRWHLGQIRGGDEGRALIAEAETWMVEQGVADCASMAIMIAPGLLKPA